MTNLFDLLIALAWPVTVYLIVRIFQPALSKLLDKDNVSFQLPNGPVIKLSSSQAAETLGALFNDFLSEYNSLLNDFQKDVYRRIIAATNPPKVCDLIPDFSRDNPEHMGCLRALRGLGLIRPELDKSWEPDSRVVVTKFGKSLNKYLTNCL